MGRLAHINLPRPPVQSGLCLPYRRCAVSAGGPRGACDSARRRGEPAPAAPLRDGGQEGI
ncbi:MAG: hypothetical protein OXU61_07370 [Gammaproteobacteria bacterium]|nr:hypothetical protein [Gammaproteobacteria bacterium]